MRSADYVRGRLEGLFQLVVILREVISEEEAKSNIVRHLVEHIYKEIEEILEYLGEDAPDHVKEKVNTARKSSDVQEKVAASYDVLSELIQKKMQEG